MNLPFSRLSGGIPVVPFAILAVLAALPILDVRAQLGPQFGSSVAMSGDNLFVGEGRNLLQPGKVYVYERMGDGAWQEGEPLAGRDVNDSADGFGMAVSARGAWLAVGAPEAMLVHVYRRQADGSWQEALRLGHDAPGFGSKVLLDGANLIVTAEATVHAYRLDGDEWLPFGDVTGHDRSGGDRFGDALALTGDRLYVGAPDAQSGEGRVYGFLAGSDGWVPEPVLTAVSPTAGDQFGASLAASGERLFVGSPGANGRRGTVVSYLLEDMSADRVYQAPIAEPNDLFGQALALDGDVLLVGASGANRQAGAVHAFHGADWSLFTPQYLQFRSGFGSAIALNGGVAVVGAPGHDNFEGVAFTMYREVESGAWQEGEKVYSDSGVFASITGAPVECAEEAAAGFPCSDVDLVSFLSRSDVGAKRGIQMSDVWGWTDEETGREYALVGRTDGTSIIDLTDAEHPVYVGDLPMTATANQSLWRDVKTYRDHMYVVADGAGAHHVQIFDLTQLRDLDMSQAPFTFTESNIYKGVYSSHNIVINEESGFAYAVGSDSGGEACGGALHMMDLSDPLNPTFAGCFNDPRTGRGGSGTTHDAQCVIYRGPDADYTGREICLSSNGTGLSIADVTDKANPVAVSVAEYPAVAYAHQGWLTEDHRYFYLNDEGDEASGLVEATRTLILDLADLDEPTISGEYYAPDNAIDHNLYVRDNIMYQTNYVAGLRLLDVSDPENPVLVGSFDTVPYGPNDNSPVLGAWSNYPYFKSGVIVVSSGREGVFFLKKRQVDL
ncbi:MAG: choice-of-anchor B family protein [Rhodothermales bacterium]